jgi:hypothetical protein
MRRSRTAIATAIAALGLATSAGAAQAAEAWTQVNGPISAGPVDVTQNAFRPANADLKRIAGAPHVAWSEGGIVRVAKLVGDAKVAVGGPVNRDLAAEAVGPTLAAGPGDVPWVSWIEDEDGLDRVRVARFDAATGKWVEAAPNSTINRITSPEPALSSARQARLVFLDGRPHVVFRQENPSAFEIGLVRLSSDGASWERLASPPVNGEPYFVEAHVAGGALHVAVLDFLGGARVHRYSGSSNMWTALGGLVNPGPDPEPVGVPVLMTDVGGVIHVALDGVATGIRVLRFTGGAWEPVGGALDGNLSSLRLIGGRLHVAWWDDASARVSRLDTAGTAWEDTAPLPDGAILSGVLTGVAGVPYLAYATRTDLRVARLDGTTPAGPDDNDGSEPPQSVGCGNELFGTRRGDRLTGTAGNDLIRGLRGDDRIRGLAGDDCLFGDEGNDRIEGGDGVDTIAGGDGNDHIVSGAGNDNVRAGSGNDVVDSRGRGFDTIDCGPGRDRALVGDLDRVRNCERVDNVD